MNLLAESGLVGAFSFSMMQNETYQIDDQIWMMLKECKDVNVEDLNQITPPL
jgi:hypothetical protein